MKAAQLLTPLRTARMARPVPVLPTPPPHPISTRSPAALSETVKEPMSPSVGRAVLGWCVVGLGRWWWLWVCLGMGHDQTPAKVTATATAGPATKSF